ncbi:MAG: hypothetical protein IJW43_00185 [Clostridia bacterium]|nr:hypothetical protein [Clostridia bacterium]
MKCCVFRNLKLFLIIVLSLIVAGMVVLGIFGFNKSVDNKLNYEVTVGVDQDLNDSALNVKNKTEEYFAEKGLKYFDSRSIKDGKYVVYTFTENVVDVEDLEQVLKGVVGQETIASATLNQVKASNEAQVLNMVYALAIAGVIVLVYLLIMEKPASAFTSIINAIFSVILFVALVALTRIPVASSLSIFVVISFILSLILSAVLVRRFKEIKAIVDNEKLTSKEVVEKGIKDSAFRFIAYLILIVLLAVVIAVAFKPYLIYTGVYALIAGVVALVSTVIGSAILWPALKSSKK